MNSTPGWKGKREQVEPGQSRRALEAPDVAEQYDLPEGADLTLPPEAALQGAEQPSNLPETPKEHRRLARVPERAASQADQYFHIPKDPRRGMTHDEMAYTLSRMNFQVEEEESEQSVAMRRAAGCPKPLDFTGMNASERSREGQKCARNPLWFSILHATPIVMMILREKQGLTP